MGQTAPVKSTLEAEVVILRYGKFFPQKIERKPGKFVLVVCNSSPGDAISIGVVSGTQAVVPSAAPSAARYQDFDIDLAAGTYSMVDSAHPQRAPVTITIKP
jgi:hypothetical protein